MPYTIYVCNKCGKEFRREEEANDCENNHYDPVKIVGVYYKEDKKCPYKIQIEMDNGKDVFFNVVENGWGAK